MKIKNLKFGLAVLILALICFGLAGCVASKGQKYLVVSGKEEVRAVRAGEVWTNEVDGVVVPWGVWVRMREAMAQRVIEKKASP